MRPRCPLSVRSCLMRTWPPLSITSAPAGETRHPLSNPRMSLLPVIRARRRRRRPPNTEVAAASQHARIGIRQRGWCWAGLHMVTFRTSAGKYQLDAHEISAGFASSERAHDRARGFRAERIARILAGETPVPLGEGPKTVLHALPIAPTDVGRDFQGSPEPKNPMKLTPLVEPANDWRYNLDGFVAYTLHNEARLRGYVQLFRDGGIEAVSGRAVVFDSHGGFYGNGLEKSAIKAFTSDTQLWSALGVEGPILVGLVVSGVQGGMLMKPSGLPMVKGANHCPFLTTSSVIRWATCR